MEYREWFNQIIEEASVYEKNITGLWHEKFDPNESALYLNNLRIELCIEAYKYLYYLENIICNHNTSQKLMFLKNYATLFTYLLSASSLFIAPQISMPSFAGAIFLSIKKRKDALFDEEYLYEEECEYINNLIDNFSKTFNSYIKRIETIINELGNEEYIESLDEVTKTNKIANRILDQILEQSLKYDELNIEITEEVKNEIENIISNYYKVEGKNANELLSLAITDYRNMDDELFDIQEMTRKRRHMSRKKFYK